MLFNVTLLLLPGLGLALQMEKPVKALAELQPTIRHQEHLSRLNSALDIENFQTRLTP